MDLQVTRDLSMGATRNWDKASAHYYNLQKSVYKSEWIYHYDLGMHIQLKIILIKYLCTCRTIWSNVGKVGTASIYHVLFCVQHWNVQL